MNQKILIIYAHPDKDGYNKEILKKTEEFLITKKKDYKLLDLYKMNFSPVLKKEEMERGREPLKDVLDIQKEIKERDTLIFIYPTWWGNMPAILKGFVDRVFTAGFAYKYVNSVPMGLLKGKQAIIFTTTGGPKIYNFITGNRAVKILTKNILWFCSIKSKSYVFSRALNIEKDRKMISVKVENLLKKYF